MLSLPAITLVAVSYTEQTSKQDRFEAHGFPCDASNAGGLLPFIINSHPKSALLGYPRSLKTGRVSSELTLSHKRYSQ
jgi:hypothetical protein